MKNIVDPFGQPRQLPTIENRIVNRSRPRTVGDSVGLLVGLDVTEGEELTVGLAVVFAMVGLEEEDGLPSSSK